jgi:hypothetical protein
VCGIVLALSIGVPGAVEAFTGETAFTSAVIGLGTAFGVPAVLALHGHQAHASGRFGAVAFAATVWTIDHNVLDITPSSLGTRKD